VGWVFSSVNCQSGSRRPCKEGNTGQPFSRTGENPLYGMIGGTVETSASSEARYAPLSYPDRKAARENKEMKFTALLHHLTVDLLRESFYS
jgi:hypothetical protein